MAILKARENASDTFIPVATMGVGNASQSQRGLMTAQDKVKVDSIGTPSGETDTLWDKVEDLSVDYIVEQGTSGIWTYRKWASGTLEQWGIASIEIESWIAWGSVYVGYNTVNYAIPFISIPSISAFYQVPTGAPSAWTGSYLSTTEDEQKSKLAISLMRTSTTGSGTFKIGIIAIGRWK